MLAFLVIFFGILSRVVFHIPNFTPVLALTLFAGVYLSPRRAILVPLTLMVISDIMIGFHDTILFTWGSVILISMLGIFLRSRKNFPNVILMSLASAVLFFIVTNLGAWIMMYPKTWDGLAQCFSLALPFFRSSLLSTLIYSILLFAGYEMLAQRITKTRWSKILSTV